MLVENTGYAVYFTKRLNFETLFKGVKIHY